MIGVDILATQEIMKSTFNWYAFIIGMIIVITTTIILIWKFSSNEDILYNIMIAFIVISLFTIPVSIIADKTGEKTLDHIEYKVKLSDEVSISEFLSTYQIVDQEEQILTISERAGD